MNINKKIYITAFNNLVVRFNDDLIQTFPEEKDFKTYRKGIILLNSINNKKVSVMFNNYSNLYREKIISRDESFFLKVNFYNLIHKESDTVENIINKLKFHWSTLSDSNKTKIWDYINLLLELNDKIYN